MFDAVRLIFEQEFLIRALIVGIMISLCCSLLGVSLVLKRFSMIGDGLSHVAFGAMAIAAAANIAPLPFALPIVIVSAFALLRVSEKAKIKGDAAIAMISAGALSVGVMATSMTTGMNVDIYNYMFGSILTMSESDVVICAVLSAAVIVLFTVYYNEIFAVTFDESFAKATGTKASLYNMLIASLTAVTVVIGMKMMGALLISALIIFPTVTSMRLSKSFKSVVVTSALVSVICFLTGLVFSIKFEAPTGASVVCINIFAFALFAALAAIGRIRKKSLAVTMKLTFWSVIAVIIAVASFVPGAEIYSKDSFTVVATAFVQYDFARQIVGDKGEVIMLLSPGEESHTYEPTPADIMKISECDVFVYNGGESESWVDDILESINSDIRTVKMMDSVELTQEDAGDSIMEHEHIHEDDECEHGVEEYDEHVWTSPANAIEIVRNITDAVIDADPTNREYYKKNEAEYISQLITLDEKFKSLISNAEREYIVIGDRFPLMYFTKRYALDYYAAFPGCSAQVEANPVTIASLIDKVEQESIPVVFKVDLSKGVVANTISEATGAEVEILYSCHTVSSEDFESGETYISLMNRNYEALKIALY